MISWIICGKQIFDNYNRDEISVYAAQASFFIVISSFPFLMLLLTLIQFVPNINKSDLLVVMMQLFPDTFHSMVIRIVDDLYTKSPGTLVSITALTAIWSSSRGVLSLTKGLNRIHGITRRRNYLLQRLICSVYTLLFVAACIASLLLMVLGNSLQSFFARHFPLIGEITLPLLNARSVLMLVLLILVFTGLYTWLPDEKQMIRHQIPGAVFSSLGWITFSTLFSLYFDHISSLSNYSYMYGSLAAMVLLMLWLYFCLCILLFGAEINRFLNSERPDT
ncbi:MAG: YihY/virulence factor BrkB family protein [Hungatella sp.]